ncbi:MAG TPA: hypothetical protein VNJ08_04355 [Bacteriovoracaceae bacterium]|nr:hypothetical protein [Bacteriovoracaceae bacterium]
MRYLCQVGLCVLVLGAYQNLRADESVHKQIKILGKAVSVSQNLSVSKDDSPDDKSESGVESVTQVSLFGKKIEIVKSKVQYQVSEDEGLSYNNQFYVKGKRVLAHSFENGDGSFSYEVDVPASEFSGDIFSYSLGILSLGINSGVSYEGKLKSEVSSEFLKREPAIDPQMNMVKASADVDIMAKGYIEGQVKILFIKGGVGGAISLIDGEAKASISVNPSSISEPEVAYGGAVNLLQGHLYGYVGSGRSKWISHNFYSSKGYCYAFGDSSCQN